MKKKHQEQWLKAARKSAAELAELMTRTDLPTLDNSVPGKPRLVWPDEQKNKG